MASKSLKKRGKLIVIDGTDGSGKTLQTTRLVDRLSREGRKVKLVDFPQHDKPSSYFVQKYLRGEYGSADDVGPFRGSIFYAIDRYDASFDIRQSLEDGMIVIANRYVSANMGHQMGKIKDARERKTFLRWLKHFEYELMGIPKPDLTILLFLPPEIGQKFVAQKEARAYTKGKKRDIHEADIRHLRNAGKAYLEVAKREGWTVIDCLEGDRKSVRSIDDIHEEIYTIYLKENE